jgi:hypothetical protein
MERTIISWNLMNWFTVVIMAALGYAALGGIAQLIKRNGASSGQAGG